MKQFLWIISMLFLLISPSFQLNTCVRTISTESDFEASTNEKQTMQSCCWWSELTCCFNPNTNSFDNTILSVCFSFFIQNPFNFHFNFNLILINILLFNDNFQINRELKEIWIFYQNN